VVAVVAGGFILPNFGSVCLAEEGIENTGNTNIAQMPQDFGEAGAFVMELLGGLPGAVKASWNEAKEIWRKTWVKWWVEKIAPWLRDVWQKIKIILDRQIERIRAILSGRYYDTMEQQGGVFRQEFEKEKQELLGELTKYTGPIREKFKQMFSLRNFWDNLIGKLKFSR
jgi:hypothetical protein